ncbi:MAG: PDZ domain-containing protein [Roseivirga sp.]|nr:PDZ domain-containing protein [Roseivirga sp.]
MNIYTTILLRSLITIFFSLFSVCALAQNPLGFDLDDGAKVVELSFIRESNLIIVPIKINGEGPFNFILDTGSESGMVFDKWVIGENNLVNARTVPVYAADGNKVTDLWVANNLSINFPGVSGVQQSMLVLQENFIDIENVIGVQAHGILGSEIFNRFVVEVDYEQKLLKLYNPKDFKAPRGFRKIPITLENFRPFVKATVKQEKQKTADVKLLIDTGASSALFLDADKHDNIHLPKKTVDHTLGRALVGVIEGKIGRVKRFNLGKFKFKKVTTSFPENWLVSKRGNKELGTDPRHGTVGSEILSRFRVIFDYHEKVIYLKKASGFSESFKFNSAGLNVLAVGEELNSYFVTDIIKDSPAVKAGLEKGDEIIAIDGKPAFFYSLTDINAIFRGPRGRTLVLIVRRDGELTRKELRLKPIL